MLVVGCWLLLTRWRGLAICIFPCACFMGLILDIRLCALCANYRIGQVYNYFEPGVVVCWMVVINNIATQLYSHIAL